IVAATSAGFVGRSFGVAPISSDAPITCPPLIPPPAIIMLQHCGQWSRPPALARLGGPPPGPPPNPPPPPPPPPPFPPPPRHNNAPALRPMVAPARRIHLRRAPELAHRQHHRIRQQTAVVQLLQQ